MSDAFQLSANLGLANEPKFRAALRTDEERIARMLVSIFTSESAEKTVLGLEGDAAQYFLDVVQGVITFSSVCTTLSLNFLRRWTRGC